MDRYATPDETHDADADARTTGEVTFATRVEACTAEAAHRRDHVGVDHVECHPHTVEVVHLGTRAMAVCHDCCADSGFVVTRAAEELAKRHRFDTSRSSAPLVGGSAA